MKTLLFVCSGNTCRSPLALAAWQSLTPQRAVRAISAGLWAREGAPSATHTQTIAREWGVDLSQHRARNLTAQMVAQADWICVMTGEHADLLHARFKPSGEVVLLGAFSPSPPASSQQVGSNSIEEMAALQKLLGDSHIGQETANIFDPFGGSVEAYTTCAGQIRGCVEQMARVLIDPGIDAAA